MPPCLLPPCLRVAAQPPRSGVARPAPAAAWMLAACAAVAGCGGAVSPPDNRADGSGAADAPSPDASRWLPWSPIARGDRTDRDGAGAAPPPRDPAIVVADDDGDGLDDAHEAHLARAYLPFLALHPDDDCPLSGLVVRVRPHPDDGRFVHLLYVHLFNEDCGLNGHVGDDEAFGATIDPSLPAPEGIAALVAVNHQGAFPCERTTACGRCAGMDACATQDVDGAALPVVLASRDKHAHYVQRGPCAFGSCLDVCADPGVRVIPPIVNAGEPGRPLIDDLTDQGFIRAADGWHDDLMNHDPWAAGTDFGTAGEVAGDLQDDAFLPPVCP